MSRRFEDVLLLTSVFVCSLWIGTGTVLADDWIHEGMAEPGKWTTGFRLGPSVITQDSALNTAGPLLNFQ